MSGVSLNPASGATGANILQGDNIATPATGLDALSQSPTFTFAGATARGLSSAGTPEPVPDEIVVEGKRQPKEKAFDISDYLDSSGKLPQPEYVSEMKVFILKPLPLRPSVKTDVKAENQKAADEAKAKLEQKIDELAPKIANLKDSDIVTMKDGTKMTGKEIKALWMNAKFVITDIDYTVKDKSGHTNNGSQVIGNTSFISIKAINIFSLYRGGVEFFMLHEIYHMSPIGQKNYKNNIELYYFLNGRSMDGFEKSSEFKSGEIEANNFAVTILGSIGGVPVDEGAIVYGL
jgi:hypothetical protein